MDTEAQIKEGHVKTGRDWSVTTANQGTPRISSSFQKLGGRHGTESASEPPGGTNAADTLISDFYPPEL